MAGDAIQIQLYAELSSSPGSTPTRGGGVT